MSVTWIGFLFLENVPVSSIEWHRFYFTVVMMICCYLTWNSVFVLYTGNFDYRLLGSSDYILWSLFFLLLFFCSTSTELFIWIFVYRKKYKITFISVYFVVCFCFCFVFTCWLILVLFSVKLLNGTKNDSVGSIEIIFNIYSVDLTFSLLIMAEHWLRLCRHKEITHLSEVHDWNWIELLLIKIGNYCVVSICQAKCSYFGTFCSVSMLLMRCDTMRL